MTDTHAPVPDSVGAGDQLAASPLAPSGSPLVPDLQGPLGSPDPHALLALIERGLAPNADEATRATARELWSRLAVVLAQAVPPSGEAHSHHTPVQGAPLPPPLPPPFPAMPSMPGPTSPIGAAVRSLRQLPPDQLLALLIGRLQAALPAGVTVPAPRGIQFPLVPIPGSTSGNAPR
jgi:hypothetical protein